MAIYRMDLAYHGSGFRGYARQEGLRTVQGELERCLEMLMGSPVDTAVAGRTDAGVHARGQVVSFESDEGVDTEALRRSINGIAGPDIAVWSIAVAPDGFHARHSARYRKYRYLIDTGPAPDPFTREIAWHPGRPLDTPVMARAVGVFVGEHDFSAFCRTMEGRSNVRRVDEALLATSGDLLEIWIQANAFCHQMVRSIVGHLYDIGRGFAPAEEAADVLASRDRSRVATVAPPHGLTLWEVGY